MQQERIDNKLLRPGEVLQEFPQLTEHYINERDIGRLMTIGVLRGVNGTRGCRVERHSVLALVKHINDLTSRELINRFEFYNGK